MQTLETVVMEYLKTNFTPKSLAELLSGFMDEEEWVLQEGTQILDFARDWEVPIEPNPTYKRVVKELIYLLHNEDQAHKDHKFIAWLHYEQALLELKYHAIEQDDLDRVADEMGLMQEYMIDLQSFVIDGVSKEDAKARAIHMLETGEQGVYIDQVIPENEYCPECSGGNAEIGGGETKTDGQGFESWTTYEGYCPSCNCEFELEEHQSREYVIIKHGDEYEK